VKKDKEEELDRVSIVLKWRVLRGVSLPSPTYLPPTPPIRGQAVFGTIENAR
jgi:hypothetical protein